MDVTSIEIHHISDSISFDSMIKEYRYVELSQDKGFLLGDIKQVVIDKNRIYISSNGVYCYDMEGNPLFKITEKGHANNEFLECTSISVNEGIIFMYDKKTKMIHKYNSIDGSFINNESVPLLCRDLYRINDGYVIDNLFSSDFYDGDARFLCSKNLKNLDGAYLEDKQYLMPYEDQVYYCSTSVSFADFMGHTIFSFDMDGCKKYSIQCKDANLVPDNLLDQRTLGNYIDIDETYTHGLSKVYENKDLLIGRYLLDDRFTFIYDKTNKKSVAFRSCLEEPFQLDFFNFYGVCDSFFCCGY